MVSNKGIFIASIITSFAIYFAAPLNNIIFVFIGVGRKLQPIEEFPYLCTKVYHDLIQSCEHMWIDEEERKLYSTCVDLSSRSGWSPNLQQLNASTRTLNDRVIVIDIDKPSKDGFASISKLEITGDYLSANGGKNLDVIGFDVEVLPDSTRRFYIINHRVPVDDAGNPLDSKKFGANSTFEIFDLVKGTEELKFVKTVVSDAIVTPNSVVATGDGGFVFTNDHGVKTGLYFELSPHTGSGTAGSCSYSSTCQIATPPNEPYNFPNGIIRDREGLIYIAHTTTGKITVHSLTPEGNLVKKSEIKIGVPLDNLSIDSNGDIFAAAMPNILRNLRAITDPSVTSSAAAVWRVRKVSGSERDGDGYEIEKVLEDDVGKFLPMTTVAASDPKTGRLFLGTIASDFITVCAPINSSS